MLIGGGHLILRFDKGGWHRIRPAGLARISITRPAT
jgi:hypothetical protein